MSGRDISGSGFEEDSLRGLIDVICDQFEAVWQTGDRPRIVEYLGDFIEDDVPGLNQLLIELVMIDLVYRWRSPQAPACTTELSAGTIVACWSEETSGPLLEDYAARFPALGQASDLPDELILAEFEARRQAGDDPETREYVRRFGGRAGPLLEKLTAASPDSTLHRRVFGLERPVPGSPGPPLAAQDATAAPGTHGSAGPSVEKPATDGNMAGSRIRYFGDYELLSEIGRGGMGVVYKARQVTLDRLVALKMILVGQLATGEAVKRFQTEAKSAAALDHPGIVPVFEIGEYEGCHYFSMAFIQGQTLQDRIEAGPLPAHEAAELMKKIAEAVAYAHERGVIHRDLKPANVLLDRDGQPRVTDFGLAKQVRAASRLTVAGQILGTPSYMSPEQASGRLEQVSGISDVYSLGAILYALLTGCPPFQADTVLDTLHKVLLEEPRPPRQLNARVPRDLETICLKCLSKSPRQRYSSTRALVVDLNRFLAHEPVLARPRSRLVRFARRSWNRHREWSLVGMTLCALLAVTAGWVYYQNWRLGELSLRAVEPYPGLSVELLDDRGRQVTTRSLVPAARRVPIPAGDYVLRLAAHGLREETYRVLVQRRENNEYQLRLGQDQLWSTKCDALVGRPDRINLGKEIGVLIRSRDPLLRLLRGSDGTPIWEALTSVERPYSYDLLAAETDFNQDGLPDFLYGTMDSLGAFFTPDSWGDSRLRNRPLWALSAQDGSVLWHLKADDPCGHPVGPILMPDVDGDGVADIVAVFLKSTLDLVGGGGYATLNSYTDVEGRCIRAISGKTGKELWRYHLEPVYLRVKWMVVPYYFDLSTGAPTKFLFERAQESVTFPWSGWLRQPYHVWAKPNEEAAVELLVPYPLELIEIRGRPAVVFVAGSHLIGLDSRSGDLAWPPEDLKCQPSSLPQWGDVTGDGCPEVVWVGNPCGGQEDDAEPVCPLVSVFSLSTQAPVWTVALHSEDAHRWTTLCLVDLDRNGAHDVFVNGAEWRLLHGATGRQRWSIRRPFAYARQPLVVPVVDVDGDHVRDLCLLESRFGLSADRLDMVFVIVSGADGRILREVSLSGLEDWNAVTTITTCHESVDEQGWPDILLRHGGSECVVSSRTGRTRGRDGFRWDARETDLDNDGRADEFIRAGDTLLAVPVDDEELWRRLGAWHPAQDFDGDGVTDLLLIPDPRFGGNCVAISGKDGKIIWTTRTHGKSFIARPPPHGDLNRDGVPDVFVVDHSVTETFSNRGEAAGGESSSPPPRAVHRESTRTSPSVRLMDSRPDASIPFFTNTLTMQLLSGRSGGKVWSIAIDRGTSQIRSMSSDVRELRLECLPDADGDGRPDVWFWIPSRFADSSGNAVSYLIGMLSGRNGHVMWSRELEVPSTNELPKLLFEPGTTFDADGDGLSDVLFAVPHHDRNGQDTSGEHFVNLLCVRGRDGVIMWGQRMTGGHLGWLDGVFLSGAGVVKLRAPVDVGDINGDGRTDVIVFDVGTRTVRAINGQTGDTLWNSLPAFDEGTTCTRAVLRLAKLRGGHEWSVCVSSDNATMILDREGNVTEKMIPPDASQACLLTSTDVDGDGADELILRTSQHLLAAKCGTGILWRRELPGTVRGLVLEPASPRDNRPATVLMEVHNAGYSLLYWGLNLRTGQRTWQILPPRTPRHSGDCVVELVRYGSVPGYVVLSRSPDAESVVCRRATHVAD